MNDVAPVSRSILLVDDDEDFRTLLRLFLRPLGARVDEVADGEHAVARILAEPPDLVLLDLGLPGGDGFSVLEDLRRRGGLAETRVIVLTGRERDAWRDEVVGAGALDMLTKPFAREELLRVVGEALAEDAASTREASAPAVSGAPRPL
ncbi:MAG: response regulator [Planctomycetota bacterium]